MDEVPNAPSGPATWYMPGAGVDSNSGSFITSETSGVKLRHRKYDNAWKYENEKYLAVVPFLRTIKITLDNDKDSKTGRWDNVRQALENTFRAFIDSTSISLGMGSGSTQVNLSKFADVLKADGSAKVSGESVYYHKHVTDYLEDSLSKLRERNRNRRIVVFIDDLDRCHPKQALEVLDSIKAD
jgi:KAP family P-loop domain